ncbi:MAG: esterase/lipase family protein [Candidatus Angelobacter sp.]
MSTIVLAHGVLGFGDQLPGLLHFLPAIHYFNGVADRLREQGHIVLEPQVDPIGSVKDRGNQLADRILKQTSAGDRVHILAHSMGGLDARHAITRRTDLVGRVATLVTIGTPHRGSPVADAVANKTGPLLDKIPDLFRRKLESNTEALHDLTTEVCSAFDDATPDAPGVRYINVAGDASKGDSELLLFQLASSISNITGQPNDGVVTQKSALRANNQHLDDWPVDHAGEIGWSSALLVPFRRQRAIADHLARYDAIVGML